MSADRFPDRESLAVALRELESAKLRVERDARAVSEAMRKQLVEKLLPVLDNLDRTIAAAEGDSPAVVEGVRMVRTQLESVLQGYGLERIDAFAERFDPAVHDAVATMPVAGPLHASIVEQLAPGYRFNGGLLRPVQVVVGLAATPGSRAAA
ncbi:MAG: nucleotide exchange factor GrpE [Deltaproteobacteria bacterium]|nr:nucleotide exchange factor GrpE [Deltaproteobacteria bacterium]